MYISVLYMCVWCVCDMCTYLFISVCVCLCDCVCVIWYLWVGSIITSRLEVYQIICVGP